MPADLLEKEICPRFLPPGEPQNLIDEVRNHTATKRGFFYGAGSTNEAKEAVWLFPEKDGLKVRGLSKLSWDRRFGGTGTKMPSWILGNVASNVDENLLLNDDGEKLKKMLERIYKTAMKYEDFPEIQDEKKQVSSSSGVEKRCSLLGGKFGKLYPWQRKALWWMVDREREKTAQEEVVETLLSDMRHGDDSSSSSTEDIGSSSGAILGRSGPLNIPGSSSSGLFGKSSSSSSRLQAQAGDGKDKENKLVKRVTFWEIVCAESRVTLSLDKILNLTRGGPQGKSSLLGGSTSRTDEKRSRRQQEEMEKKMHYKNKITGDIFDKAPTLPRGGILGDEMGLGKTLEVAATIAYSDRVNVNGYFDDVEVEKRKPRTRDLFGASSSTSINSSSGAASASLVGSSLLGSSKNNATKDSVVVPDFFDDTPLLGGSGTGTTATTSSSRQSEEILRTLIVAPLSVLDDWALTLREAMPNVPLNFFHGAKRVRVRDFEKMVANGKYTCCPGASSSSSGSTATSSAGTSSAGAGKKQKKQVGKGKSKQVVNKKGVSTTAGASSSAPSTSKAKNEQSSTSSSVKIVQSRPLQKNVQITLTSYDTLRGNIKELKEDVPCWHRMVLDEAHQIRNRKTACAKAVLEELNSQIRWAVTGTPILNRVGDVAPLFEFLHLEPFDDIKFFKTHIQEPIEKNSMNGLEHLNLIMRQVLLRRTKSQQVQITDLPGDKKVDGDEKTQMNKQNKKTAQLPVDAAKMLSRASSISSLGLGSGTTSEAGGNGQEEDSHLLADIMLETGEKILALGQPGQEASSKRSKQVQRNVVENNSSSTEEHARGRQQQGELELLGGDPMDVDEDVGSGAINLDDSTTPQTRDLVQMPPMHMTRHLVKMSKDHREMYETLFSAIEEHVTQSNKENQPQQKETRKKFSGLQNVLQVIHYLRMLTLSPSLIPVGLRNALLAHDKDKVQEQFINFGRGIAGSGGRNGRGARGGGNGGSRAPEIQKSVVDLWYDNRNEPCTICLDEFELSDQLPKGDGKKAVMTSCGHQFHRCCLVESLKVAKSCPLCRCADIVCDPKEFLERPPTWEQDYEKKNAPGAGGGDLNGDNSAKSDEDWDAEAGKFIEVEDIVLKRDRRKIETEPVVVFSSFVVVLEKLKRFLTKRNEERACPASSSSSSSGCNNNNNTAASSSSCNNHSAVSSFNNNNTSNNAVSASTSSSSSSSSSIQLPPVDLKIEILSGKQKPSERAEIVRRFQSGQIHALLCSLKAGGVGITLTKGKTVILCDPWWNAAMENQAIGRLYRLGQKHTDVDVYRLVGKNTIEENILQMQEQKQLVADLSTKTDGKFDEKSATFKSGMVAKLFDRNARPVKRNRPWLLNNDTGDKRPRVE
ncbi:unnamed protein product [Amoebophrya sp. A25]|nr:unnamed protein product [Amoebophrya sp. A25]|eukprot:GSA25T00016427001.1